MASCGHIFPTSQVVRIHGKRPNWDAYTSITGTPPGCFSVTIGRANSIIAGTWTRIQRRRGIFRGEFDSGAGVLQLYMHPTFIKGWSPVGFKNIPAEVAMERISVSSCDTQPDYAYALRYSTCYPSFYLFAGRG